MKKKSSVYIRNVEAVEYFFLLSLPAPYKVSSGATRPLSRDGGMEQLHGEPTVKEEVSQILQRVSACVT